MVEEEHDCFVNFTEQSHSTAIPFVRNGMYTLACYCCHGNMGYHHWSFQFPECLPENSVSVSCLDLCYSVTVKAKKVKDEKKDQTTAIVLGNLSEPEKDGEEGAADGGNRKLCYKL